MLGQGRGVKRALLTPLATAGSQGRARGKLCECSCDGGGCARVQVACWGMTKSQEMTLVRGIARQCQVQPLPDAEVRRGPADGAGGMWSSST